MANLRQTINGRQVLGRVRSTVILLKIHFACQSKIRRKIHDSRKLQNRFGIFHRETAFLAQKDDVGIDRIDLKCRENEIRRQPRTLAAQWLSGQSRRSDSDYINVRMLKQEPNNLRSAVPRSPDHDRPYPRFRLQDSSIYP